MKLIHFCITVILSFVLYGQEQSIKELDTDLQTIYSSSNLSGYGVAIFSSESIIFSGGYGYSDIERKIPFTIQSVQNIGSISKTFIGVALEMLVNQNKLDLDKDINLYLPFAVRNPLYPNTSITLRQLATHTSSINDSDIYEKTYVLEEAFKKNQELYTEAEYKEIQSIAENIPYTISGFLKSYLSPNEELFSKKNYSKNAPGEIYKYSNVGSALAALVIQEVTGQSYKSYVNEHIFEPLMMHNSFWDHGLVSKELLSTNYTTNLQPVPRYSLNTYPDGGIHTNVEDLTKYLQEIMKEHNGSSEMFLKNQLKEMLTTQLNKKQLKRSKQKHNSGLFWELKSSGSIGHNGADPGVLTFMYFDPKKNIGAILFTNCTAHYDESLMSSIKNIWKTLTDFKYSIQ